LTPFPEKGNPKPDQLEKIATALGLNVSVFLDFNIETVGGQIHKSELL